MSMEMRVLWLTVSKALDRSIDTATVRTAERWSWLVEAADHLVN